MGFLDPPIDFPALSGRQRYLAEVQRRYAALAVSWLTPVEIFSPHLGAAVARYIAAQHDAAGALGAMRPGGRRPLPIFEIGGGTGTLARDVLGWLAAHRPDLYSCARYCCVEISPALAELQAARVAGRGAFSVVRGDAGEAATWAAAASHAEYTPTPSNPCFVLAMEVLDNLPHDRVWRPCPGAAWQETLVAGGGARGRGEGDGTPRGSGEGMREVLRPVEDPLVTRCLREWAALEAGDRSGEEMGVVEGLGSLLGRAARRALGAAVGDAVFLPTGAARLFDALHAGFPGSHRLLAADFDALPETVIPGAGAPLVASTAGGATTDHGTYLVPPGAADIFFPSNFELLARLYSGSGGGRAARHAKAAEFFGEWAPAGGAERRCADGYDPMLEDYTNTAVLVS